MGFTCSSAYKDSVCNVGDLGLIPGLGRSPGEFSGLENSVDRKGADMTELLSLYFL